MLKRRPRDEIASVEVFGKENIEVWHQRGHAQADNQVWQGQFQGKGGKGLSRQMVSVQWVPPVFHRADLGSRMKEIGTRTEKLVHTQNSSSPGRRIDGTIPKPTRVSTRQIAAGELPSVLA